MNEAAKATEAVAKPGLLGKFLGRWGWPIMGVLAAAPVLAHALDWRSRATAKQKLKDEAERKRQQQMHALTPKPPDISSSGQMTYKMAAFSRALKTAPNQSTTSKLDALQRLMMNAKMDVPRKAGHGAPSTKFRAPAN
jgi:hypothetical protein